MQTSGLLAASIDSPLEPEPNGRDLLAPNAEKTQSRPYFASLGGSRLKRYGLIDGEYRLVVSRRNGNADARLTHRSNDIALTAAAPQIVKPMRQRLNRIRKRLARGREETLQVLSDEERKSLEALGYVGETEPR